jgi:cytidylate kinase
MIIAIDGVAGSGKSSTARKVADILGFNYFTTGKMYRAFTLYCIENNLIDNLSNLNLSKLNNIDIMIKGENYNTIYIDGIDYTSDNYDLYSNTVNESISKISCISIIRDKMVKIQRFVSKNLNIVCEGRDIGTVVFPEAELKFFFKADLKSRVSRRYLDMKSKNKKITKRAIRNLIIERDYKDMNRIVSPLKRAKDSFLVITTNITMDEQVNFILDKVNKTRKTNDK